MNLFQCLRSLLHTTRGAIKPLNALIISGAAGAVFAYTVNTAADKQIAAQRAVRSLTSIEGTNPQQGMLQREGLLTSINVQDGYNQLANNEERARMKGNSALDKYNANQRALDNMDASLGRAAQFSESDGLNTANREYSSAPNQYMVGNPQAEYDEVSTNIYKRRAAQGADSTDAGQNRLQAAAITRASGSGFSGTSQAVANGAAGGGATAGTRLSGAMPGGSNIVSQMGLADAGRTNTTFRQGRDARMGRGQKLKGERDEIKDIMKKSAQAAANPNASGNEGGRAFMATSSLSGGVTVDGAAEEEASSSEDLAAPTARKLKAVGNRLQQEENKQEERNKAHRKLIAQLIATIVGSIATIHWASKALPKMHGFGRVAAAIGFFGAVAAANTALFFTAKYFINEYGAYGGTGVAKVALILSVVLTFVAGYVVLRPEGWSKLRQNVWDQLKQALKPVNLLVGQIRNSLGI